MGAFNEKVLVRWRKEIKQEAEQEEAASRQKAETKELVEHTDAVFLKLPEELREHLTEVAQRALDDAGLHDDEAESLAAYIVGLTAAWVASKEVKR